VCTQVKIYEVALVKRGLQVACGYEWGSYRKQVCVAPSPRAPNSEPILTSTRINIENQGRKKKLWRSPRKKKGERNHKNNGSHKKPEPLSPRTLQNVYLLRLKELTALKEHLEHSKKMKTENATRRKNDRSFGGFVDDGDDIRGGKLRAPSSVHGSSKTMVANPVTLSSCCQPSSCQERSQLPQPDFCFSTTVQPKLYVSHHLTDFRLLCNSLTRADNSGLMFAFLGKKSCNSPNCIDNCSISNTCDGDYDYDDDGANLIPANLFQGQFVNPVRSLIEHSASL
jgi:hypothetical protein